MADISLDDLIKAKTQTMDNNADAQNWQVMTKKEEIEQVTKQTELISPEDRKRIDEIKENIDLTNSQTSVQYGINAQRNIAEFSDSILNNIRSKDSGHVGDLLSNLVVKVKGFDVDSKNSGGFIKKIPILGSLVGSAKSMMAEYDKLSVMDKWLLSKLNTLIKTVDDNLANYRIPESARALQDFVDDMSNWYVRRSRERFWAKGMEQDKINAYMTLYTALVEISKAAAPMIPFMTEDIYQNIVKNVDATAPESIHLCDFPEVNEAFIDKELEENMENVLEVVVMGRACRNASGIKNRQPIGKMMVKAEFDLSEFYKEIIEDELNVKTVEFTDDVSAFTSYSFKPQLKTVGPKYGKVLGKIKAALAELDGNKAMAQLNAEGALKFDFDGTEVVLEKDDLLIDTAQVEGYVSESDNNITVVLDTNLSPELIEEGFVREIISKIQTMRKEAGFEVMDKIVVNVSKNDSIIKVVTDNLDEIKAEVLANEIVFDKIEGYSKEWNINGEKVTLGVEKVQ